MTNRQPLRPAVAGVDPNDPEAVVKSALATRDSGRPDDAVPLVRSAIENQPGNHRLWHALGLLHRAREDSAAAIEALGEAVRLAPTDQRANHALARVTLEAGLPAFHLFERARQLSPSDGDVLLGRGAAQLAEGQAEQAIADLEAILGNNPNWVPGQTLLAELRWMSGDRAHFVDGFKTALAQHPADPSLWAGMLNSLVQAGLFAEADAAVRQARNALGDRRSLATYEATCASEIRDDDRADRLFEEIAPITEIPVAARFMRHMLRTGRAERAAACGEPLTASPDANQVWPYLALVWRMLDDERWEWLEGQERLIQVHDLSEAVDFAALADRLRSLHIARQDMVGQSVRGGTQTDGPLFARIDPEVRALRAAVVAAVERHMAALAPLDPSHPVLGHAPAPVRFGGSWSVRLTGEGYHTSHIHPRGWLSSALYVSVPDTGELGDPPAGWLAFGRPPAELGIDLPALRLVEPRPGRLVIFPSIMWHGTMPFDHGERLTVAFDVAPPSS
jgi:Flp pilus assembly protein TadD